MRLKELRNQYKISQEVLAEKLDVSQQTISKYENNRRLPDLNMIIKLADYFHVSIDYLLERVEQETTGVKTTNGAPIRSFLPLDGLSEKSVEKLLEYKHMLELLQAEKASGNE